MFAIKEHLPMIVTALIVLAIVFLFREVASLKRQLSDIVMVEVDGQETGVPRPDNAQTTKTASAPSTTAPSTQKPKDDATAAPAVTLQQQ